MKPIHLSKLHALAKSMDYDSFINEVVRHFAGTSQTTDVKEYADKLFLYGVGSALPSGFLYVKQKAPEDNVFCEVITDFGERLIAKAYNMKSADCIIWNNDSEICTIGKVIAWKGL